MTSVELRTALAWKNDWTGEYVPGALDPRDDFLRGIGSSDLRLLANRVREARKGRAALARELAFPVEDELELVSNVESTSDPFRLLDLAAAAGSGAIGIQQRFEALCLFDLAAMMFELERIDPMDQVEEDQRSIIGLLERDLFDGTAVDLDIFTHHDPSPGGAYRILRTEYDRPTDVAGTIMRKHNSRCRVTRSGIVTHFTGRPKDRFDAVLKLLRQVAFPKPGRDPHVLKDRCRCTFVVRDVDDAVALGDELKMNLRVRGAEMRDGGDNLTRSTGKAADTGNPFSSKRYRKRQFDVFLRSRWYEIQIVTFAGYYGARYTIDEENHVIYKLRQALVGALPMLFPGHIYLEERTWDDPALQRLLLERQRENLGWPYRRLGNGNGTH